MNRFLVCFTTPVQGGWKTVYVEAWAIVIDRDGTMPYGWRPDEIGGIDVQEVKWIIPLDVSMAQIALISGEYDKDVELPGDGSAVIVCDATFSLASEPNSEVDEIVETRDTDRKREASYDRAGFPRKD